MRGISPIEVSADLQSKKRDIATPTMILKEAIITKAIEFLMKLYNVLALAFIL